MYLQNKYTNTYYNIIAQAKSRTTTGYTEKHHIIPRSLGGSNDPDNLVVLTAREHFVCHLLLPKMLEGNNRRLMIHALWGMCNQHTPNQQRYKPSSKLYEHIRIQAVEAIKEARSKQDNTYLKGRKITWADKISKTLTGYKWSAERNAKISKAHTGRKRPKHECEAISKGLKGRDPWWSKVRFCCIKCKHEVSAVGKKRHFAKCDK